MDHLHPLPVDYARRAEPVSRLARCVTYVHYVTLSTNMHPCRSAVIAFALLSSTVGCSRDPYVPGQAEEVLGVPMGAIRNSIAARVDSGAAPTWVNEAQWKRVKTLYANWNHAPLWLEPEGVRDRATALLKVLEEAPKHALLTDQYPIDSIRRVVNADNLQDTDSPEALAEADVVLTAAYAAYANDMLVGQIDPKAVAQSWHIPPRKNEVDSALVRTLQSPSMAEGLAAMAPQDEGYTQLTQEYARYQQIVAAGGWEELEGTGSRGALVAERLRAEGFEADTADIGGALEIYQERHGLEQTGKLNGLTLRALNVPAEERLRQIAINLERHRWLPRSLGSRYIYVNVPAFRLEAYDLGQKALEMKVVVGAEYDGRSTPVFADSMEFAVFRPYWNVTPRIAANEFFPKYGNALPAGYEFWREGGELRIRQRPGEKNSLGLVKFMFPNSFNIYLHDTPAKSLFRRADRAASHGCIRVAEPARLAEFVLGWDGGRVEDAMHGSDNRHVKLPSKIPVYIVYFTAYMRDGHLHFGGDVYDRDDELQEKRDSVVPQRIAEL
jgi:murein L,D-transpeptidase YcbB/YkuD